MIEQIINGINYRFDEETKTAEVIKKKDGYAGDIIIPESVVFNEASYLVTSIGEAAFWGCESLKSITIGNNVQTIGNFAFSHCKSLTTVTLGKIFRISLVLTILSQRIVKAVKFI